MQFYISPETKEQVEHKINLMFKHCAEQPKVTFNPVEQVIKQTVYDYGMEGHSRKLTKINAIKVEIDDIKAADWSLVATVDYKLGQVLVNDISMFKSIPSKYGIEYTKCDHCGCNHGNRSAAHILFNKVTGEWMQVGSTCINKMVDGGKYLNNLIIKLSNVISMFGGCYDEEWESGGWRPSNRYMFAGVKMTDAMAVCQSYMDNVSNVWTKSSYANGRKVGDGTNDFLMAYYDKVDAEGAITDEVSQLFENVKSYYDTIPYGEVEYEPTLTQKIKDAFKNEYIIFSEMYIPWFAIETYKKSISAANFDEKLNTLGIEKGSDFNFCGDLVSSSLVEVEDFRGFGSHYEHECIFKDDATGILFEKSIANMDVVEKMKQADGKYKFTATVKYIAYKKQHVGFGGRLKKTK